MAQLLLLLGGIPSQERSQRHECIQTLPFGIPFEHVMSHTDSVAALSLPGQRDFCCSAL